MNSNTQRFSMSPDPNTIVFSVGLLAFLVGVFWGIGYLLGSIPSVPSYALYLHYGIAGLVIAIFPIVYMAGPRNLELTDRSLTVHKTLGAVSYSLHNVKSVRVEELTGLIRTMGVGGFFGSWGEMKSHQIDKFEGYITRSGPYVVVERTDGWPLVVTPTDVEGFVVALKERLATAS